MQPGKLRLLWTNHAGQEFAEEFDATNVWDIERLNRREIELDRLAKREEAEGRPFQVLPRFGMDPRLEPPKLKTDTEDKPKKGKPKKGKPKKAYFKPRSRPQPND